MLTFGIMQTRRKTRIFLLMLAFGLASVRFLPFLYDKWTEVYIDLPKVESDSPIFVFPKQILNEEVLRKRSLINKERDLSQFDNGGEFTNQCFPQDDIKGCEKKRIEARKFIFKHWKEKKRGFILYNVVGADCITDVHIFIEPGENGKWRIVEMFDYSLNRYAFYEDDLSLTIYNSVKFKRATKDDYPFEIGEYYLSFLDENGKEGFGL